MSWGWEIAALPVVVYAFIVAAGFRRLPDTEIDRWIDAYGAPVDEDTRSLAERYLTRTRRIRFSFAILGLGAWMIMTESTSIGFGTWISGLVGYLVGSVVAELTHSRPIAADGSVSAVLSRRSFAWYMPRYVPAVIVALPVACAASAAWLVQIAPRATDNFAKPDAVPVGAGSLFSIVLTIVVGSSMWAIVRRPQPASSIDAVAADDAFRSSSMHAMAGALVTLDLLLLSYTLSKLQNALSAIGSGFADLMTYLSMLAFAMTLAAWLIIGHPSSWRTPRSLDPTPTDPRA